MRLIPRAVLLHWPRGIGEKKLSSTAPHCQPVSALTKLRNPAR